MSAGADWADNAGSEGVAWSDQGDAFEGGELTTLSKSLFARQFITCAKKQLEVALTEVEVTGGDFDGDAHRSNY